MKKTARNIILFVVAVVLIAALAGCNQEPAVASDGALQVETIRFMPYAYMGESFDLREVLLMEEGVEYSATALYVDISTKTEYTLEVNDLCFTPEAVAETVVVITAKRGNETASKVIYIPTTIRAEPLDDLYKSSGTLGGSDPGISKSVNIDPLFLKGENSTTSLHVEFNSADPHPYGNLFMSFSAPEAQEHFTDKIWENAIVTFWVYNPMDQDIEFQLRIVDAQAGTNLDWQTVDGPHKQRAAAGQWTQLFFSLRKMGTTHKLTASKYTNDMISLKFRYDGYSTTETYSFDFYIDDIDVVDASMYPEIDTKYVLSNETIEQGWENMAMDTGWQGVYTEYDYEYFIGEGSTCSLKATFPGDKGKTNSFICLSPEAEFDENPDMTGGKLSAYFKFENMPAKVSFDILNKKWETSNKIDFPLKDVGDGWYYGEINLEDVEVGSGRNDEIIRIRFHFTGVSDDSVVYMDTAIYEYKYVNKVLESVSADWINLPTDRGDYYWNVESKYVTNYLKGSNTVRSLFVSAPANAAGKFTFNPSAAVTSKDLSVEPNMSYGTMGAWFYFGKQLPNASMRVTSDNWKGSIAVPFVFTQNAGDGWYYGELHGSDIKFTESANASKIIRFTIDIPKGYSVYVDNLHWNSGVENTLTAAEIDPSVLYDGGDFLAGTDIISYDKHHWENVDNDDGKPDTQVGLTCGVDTANVYGPYSVRSWYFKAAAENATANAIAQLKFAKGYDMTGKLLAFDIRIDSDSKIQQAIQMRLHTAGWSDINTTNKAIKLNSDETWKTVVIDFSDVYLPTADITNFGMISFYFDFAANTGKDRTIYIDNVRLIKPENVPEDAITADEVPEELDPSDMYDGGDLLANAYPASGDNRGMFSSDTAYSYDSNCTNIYTENEVGAYSVKSWSFSSTKDADSFPTALVDLGRSVNMNGKALAMDVFFENTKGTVAIYTLHNSGWSNLNASENAANYVQNTASGKWVTLYFDITKYLAEGKDLSDVRFIKFQFFFDASDGTARTVYIDNVRLVDPELVPPADDPSTDWTNMVQDKGSFYHNMVTNEFSTDYVKGEYSAQSLHVVAPADAAGKFTLNTDYAVTKGEIEKKPNMNAGTLGAWFYFGDQEPAATLKIGEAGWDNSRELSFVFGEGEDGWYYGTVDCSQATFPKTFYPGLTIRATVGIPAGYDVFIDSMTFTPADVPDPGELTEDPGDLLGPVKALEYNADHWTPANGLTVKPNTEILYTADVASIRSMSFFATAAANMERACAQFKLAAPQDMTGYNLAFDIFYDADTKAQQKISIRLHANGDMTGDETVKVNAGEWKTVVVNFDDVLLAGKNYTNLSLISFYFDFAANTGVERKIYIDNVRFTKDGETADDRPAPLDPSELYDGGDLLADAKVEWNPSLWGGDPATADGNSTEVYTGNNVGEYSVKSWKFSTMKDSFAEGIQLKLKNTFDLRGKNLVFDVKFVNAKQTIGIELFNGWTALQPNNTALVTLTGDGSDDWQTFTVSGYDLYDLLAGKNHDEIALIRFKFDFTSDTAGEHAVYIDNLRVTDSTVYEYHSDLLGTTSDVECPEFTDNGLTVEIDTDNVTGSYSTRSWQFGAPADFDGVASAKFDIGRTVNMTGKYLVFDAKTSIDQKITVQLYDENGEALTSAAPVSVMSNKWTDALAAVGGYVLEGKDLTKVQFIEFTFEYTSNTGAARTMNIDNVQLIDEETVEDDWIHIEKIVDEEFFTGETSLDNQYVKAEDSVVSLKLTAPADNVGMFTLDMTTLEKNLNHRGTLSALFYFGDQEPMAVAALADSGANVVTEALVFSFTELSDGWYTGTINLGDAVYAEGVNRGYVVIVSIAVAPGYTVYIDGLTYTDITETADIDMIHIPHTNGTISTDKVHCDSSAQSLYVEAASSAVNLVFTPEQNLTFADGKITAWVYFGDSVPSANQVRFAAYSGSTNTGYLNFSFGEGVNGWYLGTVDMADVPAAKQSVLNSVTSFRVQVRSGANVYIDEMTFVPNETAE